MSEHSCPYSNRVSGDCPLLDESYERNGDLIHDRDKLRTEVSRLTAEVDRLKRELAEARANAGKLPKEPTRGLLMSMAIRYDHGLGIPGFYDAPYMGNASGFHQRKLDATLRTMHQLYEEASGHGFWSPENDCEYVAKLDARQDGGREG